MTLERLLEQNKTERNEEVRISEQGGLMTTQSNMKFKLHSSGKTLTFWCTSYARRIQYRKSSRRLQLLAARQSGPKEAFCYATLNAT